MVRKKKQSQREKLTTDPSVKSQEQQPLQAIRFQYSREDMMEMRKSNHKAAKNSDDGKKGSLSKGGVKERGSVTEVATEKRDPIRDQLRARLSRPCSHAAQIKRPRASPELPSTVSTSSSPPVAAQPSVHPVPMAPVPPTSAATANYPFAAQYYRVFQQPGVPQARVPYVQMYQPAYYPQFQAQTVAPMAYMASSLPVMSPSYNNLPPQQQIYAGMPRGHQTPTMAPPPSIPNPQRQQPQQMQFQPARTLVFDKPTKKQRRTSSGSMGDDAMPEWMEGGPVDVDDTVELRGFDKSDDGSSSVASHVEPLQTPTVLRQLFASAQENPNYPSMSNGPNNGVLKAAELERELMQKSSSSSGDYSPENAQLPSINMKLPAEMISNKSQMTEEQVRSTRAELQYGWSPRKVPIPMPSVSPSTVPMPKSFFSQSHYPPRVQMNNFPRSPFAGAPTYGVNSGQPQQVYVPVHPQQPPQGANMPYGVPSSYGVNAGQNQPYVPMQQPPQGANSNATAAQMLQNNPSLRAEFYEFLKQKMSAYQTGQIQESHPGMQAILSGTRSVSIDAEPSIASQDKGRRKRFEDFDMSAAHYDMDEEKTGDEDDETENGGVD